MTQPKRSNWGGKRVGAGRPKAPHVTVKLRVEREIWEWLLTAAEAEGCTPDEGIENLLQLFRQSREGGANSNPADNQGGAST